MKSTSLCFALAAALLVLPRAHAQYPGSEAIPAHLKKGFDTITISDAKAWLGYLAGPECEGRGTLQPGFRKAADYMAARFKEFGLKPVGDKGTYFQMVRFAKSTLRASESSLSSLDGATRYAGEGEIAFGSLNKNLDLAGEVVFLRASGTDNRVPESARLGGKLVIVAAPRISSAFRAEINAQKPLAILQVQDEVTQFNPSAQRVVTQNLNRITIARAAAMKMAADMGLASNAVDSAAGEAGKVDVFIGRGRVKLTARFDESEAIDVPNVVAYLEGSDPRLKHELVGIGAHLDHLGKRGDRIYWGADDDGSGSTALLAVAKALAGSATRPKRSVLFMAFCGEEMGLIGSGYYSDNPIFPHDNMVAELQMDMVGRDSEGVQNGDRNRVDKREENIDTMRLVGSKRISTDLHNAVLDANRYINFKFKWDAEDVYTRSDHYNFAKVGIPIAFLFDGFHPDYHQPTDTVDKINFEKLTNAAKLFYIVATDLTTRADRPRKDVPPSGADPGGADLSSSDAGG